MDLLLPRRTPPADDKMGILEQRNMMDEDVLHQLERRDWSAEMAAADLYTSRGAGGGGAGGGIGAKSWSRDSPCVMAPGRVLKNVLKIELDLVLR